MARWASAVKTTREQHKNVLLLDGGTAFQKRGIVPEASAMATIEGMNLIRYDALNIGAGELSFGVDFFQEIQKKSLFPFVSANLFWRKNSQPLGERFLTREFGNLRVGITGILSPSFLPLDAATHDGIVAEDPARALKRILPEIQKQADIIILLSYAGEAGTRSLLREMPEIDIAIIGYDSGTIDEPLRARNTLLLKNAKKGMYLGVLEVRVGPKSSIVRTQNSLQRLSKEVSSDPEVGEILQEYRLAKRSSLKERVKAKRRQELHEELLEQLNSMNPEEFLRKMQENNQPPLPPE